jgi:hypothetical protein
MAHREFVDVDGTSWQMWEVHPTLAERRLSRNPVPPPHMEERRKQRRTPVPGQMRAGWLAMQSATERRRITPVPEGWSLRTDDELRSLLKSSENTGRRRRLIE